MLPYGIAGTVQNKVTTSEMAAAMTLTAATGHACGIASFPCISR